MKSKTKRILSAVSTVLVAVVVLFAVLLVGVRLIGLQVFTVLSGSMEPAYGTGSLIYVKKVDPEDIKTGDVITFMLDADTVATHRVIEVIPDEEDPEVIRFRTKGDANDSPDGGAVHCKNVIRRAGYVHTFSRVCGELYTEPAGDVYRDRGWRAASAAGVSAGRVLGGQEREYAAGEAQ